MHNQHNLRFFLLTAMLGLALTATLPAGDESTETRIVREAFDLRCSGQATEAVTLLEKVLADHPDSAAASYELARTRLQLGLGNPQESLTILPEVRQLADQAVARAPERLMYRYFDCHVAFMQAYLSLMREPAAAPPRVAELGNLLDAIWTGPPACPAAGLQLVELYAVLDREQGGDRAVAERYAAALQEADLVWGARARALLLPEGEDTVAFWEKMAGQYPDSADVQQELGRAHLFAEAPEAGAACFEKALRADPARTILLLDLARYYMYQIMRDKTRAEALAPQSIAWLEKYLATQPIAPLKAYALGIKGRLLMACGDQAEGQRVLEEAAGVDPHYSRVSGVPGAELFVPPGETVIVHRYLFRPF
ncbi:MAG: hypothetical protein JXQ27_10975 [Acidobacteria bacterium]|nr:hypothetical protein [Acidobacteriota bacterium]